MPKHRRDDSRNSGVDAAIGDYPKFNEAHPPLMKDPDHFPPDRSAVARIGKPLTIGQDNFFGVHDPKYPWIGMPHNSPSQWQHWKALQAAQKKDVDHYLVIRNQYWSRYDRRMYGAATTATVTVEKGTSYTHTEVQHESTTTRLGVELGLNLGADVFGAEPPVPPPAALLRPAMPLSQRFTFIAPARVDADDDENPAGGSNLDAKFSYEFSHTLEFTKTDETAFHETVTVSNETSFLANTQYLYWQILNEVLLFRVLPKQVDEDVLAKGEFISRVVSRTNQLYVQPFSMDPEPDPPGLVTAHTA